MPWYQNHQGENLWFEEAGQGTALVMLHGWCMSSAVFSPITTHLTSCFRVIAPDLRGHGRSVDTFSRYDFAGFADDIAALFDHLDLNNAILLGWSMGAEVLLQVFPQLRQRVAGIVLVSGTPRFAASEDFPHGLGRAETEGMALKIRRNLKRAIEGFKHGMFAPGELDDQELAASVLQALSSVPTPDDQVVQQSLQALVSADLRQLLRGIKHPTFIINGDSDRICLPAASGYMARQISGSRHLTIKACGHAPFLTRPLIFAEALEIFCRRISEPSS